MNFPFSLSFPSFPIYPFLRLIQDLFPGVWPDPFVDVDFEKVCSDIVKKRGLQPDSSLAMLELNVLCHAPTGIQIVFYQSCY